MLGTTPPYYYRSTYVVLSKPRTLSDLISFGDPRSRTARIGMQMIDEDFSNIHRCMR